MMASDLPFFTDNVQRKVLVSNNYLQSLTDLTF